ncbi:HAD family hydrolase [Tundrisphaera sp. TA3]|uniref:HAD family hydrolase n=1 Tax=Tundrisphaera sp. TA3 TaxID=3435775 RepID=UPI003EBC6DEC
MNTPRFRILALDIDGTLLDRDGVLRPRTISAVHLAARAGIRPVLCTGRRFRRALPIAEALGLDAPLVCNSGALIKQPGDRSTLWRADLSDHHSATALALFREHDEPAVTFLDRGIDEHDFLVAAESTGRPLFDDYVSQNQEYAGVDPDWLLRRDLKHFHLCAIGTREAMLAFEDAVHERMPDAVQTFVQKSPRYAGTMCEILHRDANKWTALLRLAEAWGVDPSEICAVGDDRNDIPMLRGAGLGVAMGHAAGEVLAVADHVTGSDQHDGVATLIETRLCP